MLVNLGNIFTRDENEKDIRTEFDFSGENVSSDAVFKQPVSVYLHLKRRGSDYYITLSVKAEAECTCARCLREFGMSFDFTRDFIVTSADMNDPDIEIPIDANKVLDLKMLTLQELRLEIPSVLLCEENCQGLCPVCGRPLREGCGCKVPQMRDSRLSVLDDLVFDEE